MLKRDQWERRYRDEKGDLWRETKHRDPITGERYVRGVNLSLRKRMKEDK